MVPLVVLLVEDEALILIDVEATLTDAGFEVLTARTAADALATFDHQADTIRAVISDIRLGKGQTGWDVARHVRQAVPAMPVIYMSGDGSAEWTAQGVPNSVMISKPFAGSQMVTAISTLLNQADQAEAASGGLPKNL